MTDWTEITIHRLDHALTVRVQAETPQDAAAALDPFVAPDVVLSGASTTRQQAVNAILQARLIQARDNLELAEQDHHAALEAIGAAAQAAAAENQGDYIVVEDQP